MTELTLAKAQAVVSGALSFELDKSLAPMTVVVLDASGALKAFAAEDGTPLRRADIATGKAHGALAMGRGICSRFSAGLVSTVLSFPQKSRSCSSFLVDAEKSRAYLSYDLIIANMHQTRTEKKKENQK